PSVDVRLDRVAVASSRQPALRLAPTGIATWLELRLGHDLWGRGSDEAAPSHVWELQADGSRDDDHTLFVGGWADRMEVRSRGCGHPASRAGGRLFRDVPEVGWPPAVGTVWWVRRHGPEGSTDWQRLVVGGTP
ncbi:MAG: hypothetical protein KC656_29375, partial [Myxococcales bacterium]|nr:hypothetical protein [Myxococcales bacterium]